MRINAEFLHQLKTYFLPRRGNSTLGGNITPSQDGVFNFGSPAKRWDTVYAINVVADNLGGGGNGEPGGDFVHRTVADTITARHTFNPSTAAAPFIIGSNAQSQTVVGLRADQLNRTIFAGTGITGGGLLAVDRTLSISYAGGGGSAIIPDQSSAAGSSAFPSRSDHAHSITADVAANLDVSSVGGEGTSSSFARADHTHDIITSFTPGAAAYILQTSVDGELFLAGDFGVDSDALYVDISEDAVYINSGTLPAVRGALTVKPAIGTQRGFVLKQAPSQSERLFSIYDENDDDLLIVTNAGDLESGNPGFVSGLTGWRITHDGNAEFWNAFIRGELHATIFVADELHATGGTLIVITASRVSEPIQAGDNVLGAMGAQFNLLLDASWDTGFSYFAVNDVIRLKFMGDDQGGGLDIWDIYVEVDTVSSVIGRDLSEGNPGYFVYTVTRRSGGAVGLEIPPGVAGVKWGSVSGVGYTGALLLTSDLNQSPYLDVFTIDNAETYSPWQALSIKPRVRLGNLDGLPNQGQQWGLAFGTDLSDAAKPYGIFSDLKAELHGITQSWWDASGNTVGEVDPTAVSSQSLFWLGNSESDKLFEFTKGGLVGLSGSLVISSRTNGKKFRSGLLWLPFDGGNNLVTQPLFENVDRINWRAPNNFNAVPAFQGKYNKMATFGDSATNLIPNPGFNNNITDGWVTVLNGGAVVYDTATKWIGSGSAKVTAGTGNTFLRSSATMTLPASTRGWLQARVNAEAIGKARIRIVDGSNNLLAQSNTNTKSGEWELLTINYTAGGSAESVKAELRNIANDSSTIVYFDAVQFETAQITPFIWPPYSSDMSWSGTAHNSTSSRALGSKLDYTLSMPAAWTISFWLSPWTIPVDSVTATVLEWTGDGDNFFRLVYNNTVNKLRIIWEGNNVQTNADDSTTTWVRGEWHHVMAAYSGGVATLFVNGLQAAQITGLTAMTVTPTTLYIGSNSSFSNHLNGALDDFFILTRVLVVEDAVELYNAPDATIVTGQLEIFLHTTGQGRLILRPQGIFVMDQNGSPTLGLLNSTVGVDWGGFTLGTGDFVLGNNVSGSAALLWDKSAGTFGFYGGGSGTPQVEISTDGSITAGGGNIIMNADGFALKALSSFFSSNEAITFLNASSQTVATIFMTNTGDLNMNAESGLAGYKGLNLVASVPAGSQADTQIVAESGSFMCRVLVQSATAGGTFISIETPNQNIILAEGEGVYIYTPTGVQVGDPTGGFKGNGTINAKGVYDDGVLLTDFVFEPGYEMFSIPEMEQFFRKYKHLPTIPGRDEWERLGGFSLGKLSTHLWETAEVLALYITQLHYRIKELENRLM